MRTVSLLVVAVACDPETSGGPPGPVPDEWSGTMQLEGSAEIAAGQAVVALPGTVVEIAPDTRLVIEGSLTATGTADQPITLTAPDGWRGIELHGTLSGTYLDIVGAGGPIAGLGGTLELTDSTLDLRTPAKSPDCTSINGGVFTLTHVRITGCHCPIHINSAESATVTGSVFDGAAVPVMLANLDATFTGNNFVGATGMQDVGGGISADIGGNYWGGGPPEIQTGDDAQFVGAEDFSADPIADAGPRN